MNRKTIGFLILGIVGLLIMWYLRSDKSGDNGDTDNQTRSAQSSPFMRSDVSGRISQAVGR